jgi:hypothetical protein
VIKDNNFPISFRGVSLHDEKIKPGTVIYFYKLLENVQINREINRHFAISIGENYYISIHGSTGPLAICSMDAMKEYCQGDKCLEVEKILEFKITSQPLEYKENPPASTNGKTASNLFFFTIAGSSILGGLLGGPIGMVTGAVVAGTAVKVSGLRK